MSGRKSGGGKGGRDDTMHDDDHVMEFTPDTSFNIRTSARNFADLMNESNHPLIIHLPHVSVEFEPGCTPQEIIDGYHLAMKRKFVVHHSTPPRVTR